MTNVLLEIITSPLHTPLCFAFGPSCDYLSCLLALNCVEDDQRLAVWSTTPLVLQEYLRVTVITWRSFLSALILDAPKFHLNPS